MGLLNLNVTKVLTMAVFETLLITGILFLFNGSAFGHKVIVFAWVEGGTIHTESKFSGGKFVKNGTIKVYDLEGNDLFHGKTDNQGQLSFDIPKKETLRIVLDAGMGHRAEWTIPNHELEGIDSATDSKRQTTVNENEKKISKATATSPEEIQLIVEKTMDEKLRPIFSMLAKIQQEGHSIRDILSGLGYILGLVGVGAYFHYRKKSKEPSSQ